MRIGHSVSDMSQNLCGTMFYFQKNRKEEATSRILNTLSIDNCYVDFDRKYGFYDIKNLEVRNVQLAALGSSKSLLSRPKPIRPLSN